MLLTSMFIAAAFAAANGDLPVSGDSKDRKSTYAAAEAGLNFYLNHLQQDNDYWTQCDQVPAPNATEVNPVNQQCDGAGGRHAPLAHDPGLDARSTRSRSCTPPAYTKCETDPKKQASVIDLATGTFKIRVTGRPSPTSKQRRSDRRDVPAQRLPELHLLHRLRERSTRRRSPHSSDRDAAQTNCADKYRAARAGKGCKEIQFVTGDEIKGPLHTNDDSLLVCGHAGVRARRASVDADRGLRAGARLRQERQLRAATPDDQHAVGQVHHRRAADGDADEQRPARRRRRRRRHRVLRQDRRPARRPAADGRHQLQRDGAGTTATNVPWPSNGVLYVKNNGACTGEYPTAAKYTEPATCGNVYVSGTYSQSLTIAAANDVIVRPTLGGKLSNASDDANIMRDARQRRHARPDRQQLRPRRAHGQPRNRDGTATTNIDTTTDPIVKNVHDRRRDPVAAALLHRRQLQLRPARHADGQRRDRAEVPRPGRHRHGGTIVDRLPEGLQVRRPASGTARRRTS